MNSNVNMIANTARNLEEVHEMNLALVIKLLQKADICSRAELSKASRLRQSTITNIVNELIDNGLVSETGSIEGNKGRRSIGITLNRDALKVIAIRLARTHFIVGRYNIGGVEDAVITEQIHPPDKPQDILAHIGRLAGELIAKSDRRIIGIGIALPGPLIRPEERIAMMTGTSGWERIDIRQFFASQFSVPIYLEHDAKAGALAEWWYGSGNLSQGTYVYLAAGEGIGVGLTCDGNILRGAQGAAGEIGHISINYQGPQCECGNRGCLEKYSSVLSMRKRIREGIGAGVETTLKENCSITDIAKAYRQKDAFALEVVQEAAEFLGIGLVSLVNMYNPDCIIIGDEMTCIGQPLIDIIIKSLRSRLLPVIFDRLEIRFSSFDQDPALIGAVALTMDETMKKPSETLFLR